MTYSLNAMVGNNLIEQRRNINAAQLGGVLAHLIEDCDRIVVYDSEDRIVLRYNKKGMK